MAQELDLEDAERIGAGYQRSLANNRTRRRELGAYYTPAYLVDLVLEHALLPALRGLPLKSILALRVADLSCGAGVFLVGALKRMVEHCQEHVPNEVQAMYGRGESAIVSLRRDIARQCIFGVDLDAHAAWLCRSALAECAELRAADFSQGIVVGNGLLDTLPPFDVIIGNPPWGQKGYHFDADEKLRLRRLFTCARGQLDPFKLFVERAIGLLPAGGRWGMVLPDIVLLKNYEALRRLILDECALEFVAFAGKAFADVNLDTVVVTASRGCAENQLRIWHAVPSDWRSSPPDNHYLDQRVFSEQPQARFNLHLTADRITVLRELGQHPRVGDFFEIHEGVHSGNCRSRLFVNREPQNGAKLIVGRKELSPYRLQWGGMFVDLDPAAIHRASGGYANLGRSQWHRAGKIVVRRTGDRVVAALDQHGYYVSNNMFTVLPRFESDDERVRATLGLLNSRLMTWYFRTVMPRTGRMFAELKICHLAEFPMPATRSWIPPMAELVSRHMAGDMDASHAIDELAEQAFDLGSHARRAIAADAVTSRVSS